MSIWEILIVGVSLAADAFAVAIVRGVELRRFDGIKACVTGAFFGGFQFLMPVIGWAAASTFESYITEWERCSSLDMLATGDVTWCNDRLTEGDDSCLSAPVPYRWRTRLMSVIATSIDALAVVITFAFLSVNIWQASSIIGAVTFALSVLGVFIGAKVGGRFKNGASTAGGLLLVFIGVKILLEHLGVLAM